MSSKEIWMPNGEKRTYYCGDEQSWEQIITEKILPYWEQYCDTNWISWINHEAVYAPERRVKSFLDRLGWLLIEGAEGIESKYKAMTHRVREIPVTECPADITDLLYSDRIPPFDEEDEDHFEGVVERLAEVDKRKPRPRKDWPKTRFEKIEEIKRTFPGCRLTWCIVDGENTFEYDGRKYEVPEEMRGYIDDMQMDRILAVENDKALRFYDQGVENMYILK